MHTSRTIEVQGRVLGVAVSHANAWRVIATDPLVEDIDGAIVPTPAEARRVQATIGRIEALLAANARIPAALARATDEGQVPGAAESGALKVVPAEHAVRVVGQAALLAGNPAHDRANPLERHWRDVRCARMHAPAGDAAHLAAGRAALAGATP